MYLTDNIIMANALVYLTAKMFIVMKVVLIVILTVSHCNKTGLIWNTWNQTGLELAGLSNRTKLSRV